jgi:hypothetical protein
LGTGRVRNWIVITIIIVGIVVVGSGGSTITNWVIIVTIVIQIVNARVWCC